MAGRTGSLDGMGGRPLFADADNSRVEFRLMYPSLVAGRGSFDVASTDSMSTVVTVPREAGNMSPKISLWRASYDNSMLS